MMRILLLLILSFTLCNAHAANSMKVRAVSDVDSTQVKILVSHAMETGYRVDTKTGETIPAKYITEIKAVWNDKVVFKGLPSIGVAKNPYFAFRFKGASAGDELTVNWVDSEGNTDSTTAIIR